MSLNIENLEIGSYSFSINYLVNNLTFNQNIKLIVSPKFYYENKYFEINANLGNTCEQPIMEPENGKLTIKQYIKILVLTVMDILIHLILFLILIKLQFNILLIISHHMII